MKRKIAALAATTAVLTGGTLAATTAPSNAAGNPPSMSRTEFRKIHTGMSKATVFRIVGSKGKVSMASTFLTIRQWKTTGNPYGSATIGFSGGRVQSKIFIG